MYLIHRASLFLYQGYNNGQGGIDFLQSFSQGRSRLLYSLYMLMGKLPQLLYYMFQRYIRGMLQMHFGLLMDYMYQQDIELL
jgi:hypothetical protein